MGYLLVVLENLRILNKKPESRGDSGLVSLAAAKPARGTGQTLITRRNGVPEVVANGGELAGSWMYGRQDSRQTSTVRSGFFEIVVSLRPIRGRPGFPKRKTLAFWRVGQFKERSGTRSRCHIGSHPMARPPDPLSRGSNSCWYRRGSNCALIARPVANES